MPPTEPSDHVMMIGPTKAGKTTLLAVLRLAASRKLKNVGKVRITPVNGPAKELFQLARGIEETGSFDFPGNLQTNRYEFTLTCQVERQVRIERWEERPGKYLWSKKQLVDCSEVETVTEPKSFTLTVIDGKGGDVLGKRDPTQESEAEYITRRRELVELATKSSALVSCINASDKKTTGAYFHGLQSFLDDIQEAAGRVPFERVVFAMTQSDKLVEHYGVGALSRLEDMNAATHATDALGRIATGELFEALSPAARAQVYAGWVSVYGFVPSEGSVNFDSANNRIAIFDPDDAGWLDDWVPHGVIEPFLFACTGTPGGLKPVTEPTD